MMLWGLPFRKVEGWWSGNSGSSVVYPTSSGISCDCNSGGTSSSMGSNLRSITPLGILYACIYEWTSGMHIEGNASMMWWSAYVHTCLFTIYFNMTTISILFYRVGAYLLSSKVNMHLPCFNKIRYSCSSSVRGLKPAASNLFELA